MKKIALIGFGTIGKKLYEQICADRLLEVAFIYDPQAKVPHPVALGHPPTGKDFATVDLAVEAALPQTVADFGRDILKHTHFMPFSLTSLANPELLDDLLYIANIHQHQLFIPHGAILGLDGIFDGNRLWDHVQIVTTKNPKSLGRSDTEKYVIFEGSARQVARLMPRNVNVHAALALAGIGFDKTKSILVSDPNCTENTHLITAQNADTVFEISIKSNPVGAVTGAFTPVSAYGSVLRALGIAKGNFTTV
ncbi:MAG: DUF108 domain-containing protein [Bacteroidales bacterium]|nr:DUF108 domain-containing protein [Bacteroidales bacterium]MCL2738361.1 DUF108 domain-containing protein [Bacteroidales bacterium]